MILGLSLADLAKLRERNAVYSTLGTETSEWVDVLTIDEDGEAVCLELQFPTTLGGIYCHGLRLIDAEEEVLGEKGDLVTNALPLGPRQYLVRCEIRAGCKLQACVTANAVTTLTAGIYYLPAVKTDKAFVSIFGDGKHPGDPGLVQHASICNALRSMREELEES